MALLALPLAFRAWTFTPIQALLCLGQPVRHKLLRTENKCDPIKECGDDVLVHP